MKIRTAHEDDLEAINKIYNLSIPSKSSTAHTEPVTLSERKKWFRNHPPETNPVFVAEIDHTVVGWVAISPYRPGRNALRFTREISYYIHPEYQKQGVGSRLFEYVIKTAPEYQVRSLIAVLLEHNIPSIKLLKKFGFSEWGRMPDTVEFNGKLYSHLYYGRQLL